MVRTTDSIRGRGTFSIFYVQKLYCVVRNFRAYHTLSLIFEREKQMKKVILLAVILLVLSFVPAGADKPGRIQELEARVQTLEEDTDYLECRVEALQDSYEELLAIVCDY